MCAHAMARINAPQPGEDVAACLELSQHRRESAALMHAAAQKAIEGLSAQGPGEGGATGDRIRQPRGARLDLMDKRSGITDEGVRLARCDPCR